MTRRRAFQPLATTAYDAVIVGTGLPHAILAAALALSGATVLHLDSNAFYGAATATLPLPALESALAEPDARSAHHDAPPLAPHFPPTHAAHPLPHVPLRAALFPHGARLLVDHLRSRPAFWLDVAPRPIMAAGHMVDLLVRSNVGHYLDFRPLEALYLHFPDAGLQRVPGSRADVFQSNFITMPEKRLLMRFVKKCAAAIHPDPDPIPEPAAPASPDNPQTPAEMHHVFHDEMRAMALTPKLTAFLSHSIAFCADRPVSTRHGMHAVYTYQASLMRFATKTPFLYPNYGSGELAQAFCRLCAVHGGTYVLRRGATAVIRPAPRMNGPLETTAAGPPSPDLPPSEYRVGVVTDEQEVVRARHVFLPRHLLRPPASNAPALWRVMCVLEGSITRDDQPDRVLVTVPPRVFSNRVAVRLRQLDSSVMVCPRGYFVLYAETVGPAAEEDVLNVLWAYVRIGDREPDVGHANVHQNAGTDESVGADTVADAAGNAGQDANARDGSEPLDFQAREKPKMLWGLSYACPIDSPVEEDDGLRKDGVVLVSTPQEGHDADAIIQEAERCFRIAKPEGDFFPEQRRETEAAANGHAETHEEGQAEES